MVQRSPDEENWNARTHMLGALLSAAGMVWMCYLVWPHWPSAVAIACVVYSALLVMMYVMSTLSHSFDDDVSRNRYRALDQAFIFLLITGTYTPFSIYYWNTTPAKILLTIMWAISIAGFVAKAFLSHKVNRVSVAGYVLLGWMPLIGLPFHDHWPKEPMRWMLIGGIVYSLGTMFLINDKRARWCHGAWHLSVILASAIHFAAIAKFVANKLNTS